ncbi:hypothetical protein BDV29DRAFT_161184 [Aspergillus leporis]|jgi:hypothetical protein|uniref:RelA/SpoT domain-containing protein n=1 Tax=Aspergillus leporis TaxID=41062 RepID=A0A5N5WMC1_9EURO|nr:hypothetical protein BDV29DRAFT_161184 [Aspergillus leporis]
MKFTLGVSGSNEEKVTGIEQYIQSYREGSHSYTSAAEKVAEICRTALDEAGVLHEVKHQAKESARLTAELNAREHRRGHPYQDADEIEAEISELPRICIDVYSHRDMSCVRRVIRKYFVVFSQTPETGGREERTSYCRDHYWVTFKEEDNGPRQRNIVEIQVTTCTFKTQHELGVFLTEWTTKSGQTQEPGEIQPLWELMQILDLPQPKFQEVLGALDLSTTLETNFSCLVHGYAPLPVSLVTYVIHSIIHLPEVEGKLDDILKTKSEPEFQRYKIKVIRDSLIWLAKLFPLADWTGILFADLDQATESFQKSKIYWLTTRNAKDIYYDEAKPLSLNDEWNITHLWLMFENHKKPPIHYAFSLARLGVMGSGPKGWPAFHNAIYALLE